MKVNLKTESKIELQSGEQNGWDGMFLHTSGSTLGIRCNEIAAVGSKYSLDFCPR